MNRNHRLLYTFFSYHLHISYVMKSTVTVCLYFICALYCIQYGRYDIIIHTVVDLMILIFNNTRTGYCISHCMKY